MPYLLTTNYIHKSLVYVCSTTSLSTFRIDQLSPGRRRVSDVPSAHVNFMSMVFQGPISHSSLQGKCFPTLTLLSLTQLRMVRMLRIVLLLHTVLLLLDILLWRIVQMLRTLTAVCVLPLWSSHHHCASFGCCILDCNRINGSRLALAYLTPPAVSVISRDAIVRSSPLCTCTGLIAPR